MTKDDDTMYRPETVSPPGETLLEMIEDRGVTQKQLAGRMGRPLKTINEIIKGKAAITADTALQLERVLGAPAEFWNRRESKYRDYLARAAEEKRLDEQISWLDKLPLSEMRKNGWLSKNRDKRTLVREALLFFGVSSDLEWQRMYQKPQAAFRRSAAAADAAEGAVAAWMRAGERQVEGQAYEKFDKKSFRKQLRTIRSLTVLDEAEFVPKVIDTCRECGVAVVFVPSVKGARVSGVTRWLTPTRPLMQFSFYGKYADRFWFTFFHEAAHVLLHQKDLVFLEDGRLTGKDEDEANAFAADFLIPKEEMNRIRADVPRTPKKVKAIAKRLKIAPGIVVGRLQHEKLIGFNELHDLQAKLTFCCSSTKN